MVTFRKMISLFILCLISIASCGEVHENGQEISINTTTLYPVKNIPLYLKETKVKENSTKDEKESIKQTDVKENVTKVEIESIKQTDVASSEHNKYIENLKEAYKNHTEKPLIALNSNESDMQNDEIIPTREAKMKTILKEETKWSIDATYAPSKSVDESELREEKIKDFKPSPHLGSFYDEDSFDVPTPVTESFIPYKPNYESFEKDFFKMTYKRPDQTPYDTPYRFENVPQTPDWHIESGLGPRTVEPPVKIPAGGLYKLPDPFQGKPNSDGDNEGPEFKDQKDNSVKKRGNPWKSFLHMVTALLPVGLLVSALTPNVITFENTDNNNPYYPSRVSRQAEVATSPRISERCKRRLLCEIHADQNYISNLSVSQRKPCYKLHCDDPHAMNALLRWLLNHHSHHNHNNHAPSYQPSHHDRRGYITRY